MLQPIYSLLEQIRYLALALTVVAVVVVTAATVKAIVATTTINKATKGMNLQQKDEIRDKKIKNYRLMRLREQYSCAV